MGSTNLGAPHVILSLPPPSLSLLYFFLSPYGLLQEAMVAVVAMGRGFEWWRRFGREPARKEEEEEEAAVEEMAGGRGPKRRQVGGEPGGRRWLAGRELAAEAAPIFLPPPCGALHIPSWIG